MPFLASAMQLFFQRRQLMSRVTTHLCKEAVVEVTLGQQKVVLQGSQMAWQLSMHHHQLPQLSSNLQVQ